MMISNRFRDTSASSAVTEIRLRSDFSEGSLIHSYIKGQRGVYSKFEGLNPEYIETSIESVVHVLDMSEALSGKQHWINLLGVLDALAQS